MGIVRADLEERAVFYDPSLWHAWRDVLPAGDDVVIQALAYPRSVLEGFSVVVSVFREGGRYLLRVVQITRDGIPGWKLEFDYVKWPWGDETHGLPDLPVAFMAPDGWLAVPSHWVGMNGKTIRDEQLDVSPVGVGVDRWVLHPEGWTKNAKPGEKGGLLQAAWRTSGSGWVIRRLLGFWEGGAIVLKSNEKRSLNSCCEETEYRLDLLDGMSKTVRTFALAGVMEGQVQAAGTMDGAWAAVLRRRPSRRYRHSRLLAVGVGTRVSDILVNDVEVQRLHGVFPLPDDGWAVLADGVTVLADKSLSLYHLPLPWGRFFAREDALLLFGDLRWTVVPPEPIPFGELRSGLGERVERVLDIGGWAVFAVRMGMFFDGKLVSLPSLHEDRIPWRDVEAKAGRVVAVYQDRDGSAAVRVYEKNLRVVLNRILDYPGVPEICPTRDEETILIGIRNSVWAWESSVSMTFVRMRVDGQNVSAFYAGSFGRDWKPLVAERAEGGTVVWFGQRAEDKGQIVWRYKLFLSDDGSISGAAC